MSLEPHSIDTLVERFEYGTPYNFCQESHTLYLNNSFNEDISYEENYFDKEYKTQYGKSYLEDENHLRALARKRLKRLEKYTKNLISIYEIGSAFGFFLDEAYKKYDCSCQGIEISKHATRYAIDHLSLDIQIGSFLDANIKEASFDLVCAFYVMEHISKQKSFFKKVYKILKPGAYFFFSVPSLNGPLYLKNRKEWFLSHPKDHYVDYSPKGLRKVFKNYNMKLIKTWPASYHPARYHKLFTFPFFRLIYKICADTFCYGDTIEGIAQKVN